MVAHFYDNYGSESCYERLDWAGVKSSPVTIEDKVWIGFDAVILKGVRIGEGAIVGARSVVTRDVEPYTVVAGNPAIVVHHIER
jgi:galactoside O-acetyltransferase